MKPEDLKAMLDEARRTDEWEMFTDAIEQHASDLVDLYRQTDAMIECMERKNQMVENMGCVQAALGNLKRIGTTCTPSGCEPKG